MGYSKGKWEAKRNATGEWAIATDTYIGEISRHFNAHLIVAAVNACVKVNPNNPMAVAESIKDMAEALKEITELAPRDKLRLPYAIQVVEIADKALAKANGKGD